MLRHQKRKQMYGVPVLLGALALGSSASAATWFVDAIHGNDASSGLGSFANAKQTLQAVLGNVNLVAEDQIWLANGTYVPTAVFDPHDAFVVTGLPSPCSCDLPSGGNPDRRRTFRLVKDVGLYGGFQGISHPSGGETQLSEADPDSNITILSGDLGGGHHAFHVLVYFQPWDDEVPANEEVMKIEGLTITGGAATGGDESTSPYYDGGYNATGGGALVIYEHHEFDEPPAPVFSRCVFANNSAEFSGGAFAGLYGGCRITECRFENNSHAATSGTEITKLSRGGGAINALGPVVVLKSTFVGNASGTIGGAIHHTGVTHDGGLYLVSNCKFYANVADDDGGAIDQLGSDAPTMAPAPAGHHE